MLRQHNSKKFNGFPVRLKCHRFRISFCLLPLLDSQNVFALTCGSEFWKMCRISGSVLAVVLVFCEKSIRTLQTRNLFAKRTGKFDGVWSLNIRNESMQFSGQNQKTFPLQTMSCDATEASCKSQILTAQAVVADFGKVAASKSGVNAWASINVRNSERDAHRTMKKQKTKLDVKIETVSCKDEMIPWISPETWLSWLVKKGLWPMLAGCQLHDYEGARRNWSKFWEMYRKIDPDLGIFDLEGLDLSRTAAFLVHGDEGRTLKKNGIMVTSLQSCLGAGFDEKRVWGQKDDSSRLRVNFAGHSFTTRFVVSTIPKTKYESDGEVFNVATEHLAKSLRQCLDKGYVDHARGGEHFRIAILGIKGDAPFLAKVGHFFRSYNTTAKRGEQRGAPKGVCPYCLAGTDNFPAEEIATSTPKWQSTVGVKPPWVRVPALVRHLPHNPGDPSAFYKSDIWHVVHLGFGRSWVASVLQLCLQFLEHPNLDEKWSHITEEYLTWCKQNRKQAHISKVTPYLMSYGDSAGAMGNWHKGALTCNFCTWLVEFLGKVPKARDVHGWLTWCRSSTYRLNSMFGVLYKAGAFLNSHEASFVSEQGLEFLRCYASMAQAMFSGGRQWLFPLYPKLHVFHHLLLEVRNVGASKGACINPLMFGCQMDEDTIGRCARLSRRVSIRRVSGRTLDRYLVCARAAFVNGGILK